MYNHSMHPSSKASSLRSINQRVIKMTKKWLNRFHSALALVLVSSLLFIPAYSADLNVNAPEWTHTVGQVNNDQLLGLKIDNMGSPVAVGFFHGTDMEFGGQTLSSTQKDIFVVKYQPDSEGEVQWARSIGGSGVDEGRGVAIDPFDSVYVTGNFRGQVDLGSGPVTSQGNDDIFVTKYSSNGDRLWGWSAGSADEDEGWDIAVDSASNAYVTGFFSGTVNFGNAVTGTFTSTNVTNDIFVVSLDGNGSFRWANYVAGQSGDRGNGIAVDSSRGFVYVTGFIQGNSFFDPGNNSGFRDPNARDMFLSKYSTSGQHIDTILIGDVGDRDFGQAIAVDETSGTVYLTGAFDGPADFNPGTGPILQSQGRSDGFVAAFDSGLQNLWAVGIGGSGEDVGEAISIGPAGNIYVSGWFEETADFDPDPNALFERTSAGDNDAFVLTLDANGNFLAVATIGGAGQEQSLGMGVDGNQTLYHGGFFNGTIDVNPTATEELVASAGQEDIFITALSSNLAPRAEANSVTVAEEMAAEITLIGSDLGGESITFSIGDALPSNGTLGEIAVTGATTATVTYTPETDFFGEDSFSFVVTDASGFQTSATITILVTPVNDAPTADTQMAFTANEDELLSIAADSGLLQGNSSDPDVGDTLSASADTTSAAGAAVAVAADGGFSYDPSAVSSFQALAVGEVLTDTFEFTVTDSENESDSATVVMTIEGRNDVPVANDDGGFTTPGSTPLTASNGVLGNDSDVDASDTLTVDPTPVELPTSGSVTLAGDGSFTYTPNDGFSGVDTFRYKVVDGNGGEATAQVSITVGDANVPPTVADSSAEVNENETLNGPSLLSEASDPNGDLLTIESTALVPPENGTVVLNPDGTYIYTPATDFSGTDSFQYRVCDNGIPVQCGEATVTITVLPAPEGTTVTLTDDALTITSGESSVIDVLANDSTTGEGALSFVSIGTPDQGGSVSINAENQIRYIPADGFVGTESFTYTVVDSTGTEATGTVTVTVEASEQPVEQMEKIFVPALVQ